MCGIYGSIGADYHGDPGARLAHRGPDGRGERRWSSRPGPAVLLGHRRLAILDLRPEAGQPMGSSDGRFWLTFNGEIYNYRALRSELARLGYSFRTESDTEVLLHGFAAWGEGLLPRLEGMFAFAIWDEQQSCLWLVRDRLGKKPIFYHLNADHLVFGSEIKALLEFPAVPREPDPIALDHFLSYFYFPYPLTAFRGIAKLGPASWMRVELTPQGGLRWRQGRYWNPIEAAASAQPLSVADALDRTREALTLAVQKRLISDVPLGAFLSGGLDSSSIVGLAASCIGQPLATFSISFPGNAYYDETAVASEVAARFARLHTVLPVDLSSAEWLPTVVRHFDEPFGNPTAILQYQLTRAVRPHVTVALSGDGGDETFLGYHRYQGARWAERYRQLPAFLTGGLAAAARSMPEATSGWQTPRRAREFLEYGALPIEEAYLNWVGYFSAKDKQALYTPEWRRGWTGVDPGDFLRGLFAEAAALPTLNRLSYVDLFSFLCCNVLEYSDRMSMANSVEVRCPFTDHALVELLLGQPPDLKLHGGVSKGLLRLLAQPLLPTAVTRGKKRGFSPPLERWMEVELGPILAVWLGRERLERRGMLQPAAVEAMIAAHQSGRRDNSVRLWGLLALEAWFSLYFDGASEAALGQEIQAAAAVSASG